LYFNKYERIKSFRIAEFKSRVDHFYAILVVVREYNNGNEYCEQNVEHKHLFEKLIQEITNFNVNTLTHESNNEISDIENAIVDCFDKLLKLKESFYHSLIRKLK